MPFKFSHICQLLSDLEATNARNPPLVSKECDFELKRKTQYWFRCHRRNIDLGEVDGVALLSTLLPEKRTDRVYGLQETRLCKVLARCLRLNNRDLKILQDWNKPGRGDLGACLMQILKSFDCEQKPGGPVTIEEVDHVLQNLASQCRFSGPIVRSFSALSSVDEQLAGIFRRLSSEEAKWFVRIILKKLVAARIDYNLVISEFHFLLPSLLRFQDSLVAACTLLRTTLKDYTSQPEAVIQRAARADAARLLAPIVGTKVGRQAYLKARSMQHCVNLCGSQKWSAERKYDGEYCEVHIDMSKGDECIQIFSKSGKDSTWDRQGLHGILKDCLRLGESGCMIKSRCILTGELVVYSDSMRRILDFYHLRKHIARSGVFLGRDKDSQIKVGEHLMIMLYDILLLDNENLVRAPYTTRRERLREVVRFKEGHAMPAERSIIDFSHTKDGRMHLCKQFAAALANRCEGLVLKPLDTPYFRFSGDGHGDGRSYVIKLKKDYLQELGELRDVADLAVVGASFDSKLAHKSTIRNPGCTSFYLGCCINKSEAERFGAIPLFQVVGAITIDQCIPPREFHALHNYFRFMSRPMKRAGGRLIDPQDFDLMFNKGIELKMQFVFETPCVAEVLGSGFEKPSNCNYYMLRHPRILRIHADRTWRDACTFEELAELACSARAASEEGETQEMSQLMKELQGKFQRRTRRLRRDITTTPQTSSTTSPVSARTTKTIGPEQAMLHECVVDSAVPVSRSRRSPTRKGQPPVSIRVDTAERSLYEMPLGSSPTVPANDRPEVAESLPTPPVSFGNKPLARPLSIKRKSGIPFEHTATQKRAKRAVSEASTSERRALQLISHNSSPSRQKGSNNIREALDPGQARALEAPPTSPVVSRKPAASKDTLLSCPNANCPFANSIVFLSPCVRGFSWVSQDLMPWHGAEQVVHLHDWSRERTAPPSSMPTVQESLSFPGLQKIVLVELNRLEATLKCVSEIKKRKIGDLVLYLDWRVLEDWQVLESRESQEQHLHGNRRAMLEKRYFGFTSWSVDKGEVIFMHRDLARMPSRWLDG